MSVKGKSQFGDSPSFVYTRTATPKRKNEPITIPEIFVVAFLRIDRSLSYSAIAKVLRRLNISKATEARVKGLISNWIVNPPSKPNRTFVKAWGWRPLAAGESMADRLVGKFTKSIIAKQYITASLLKELKQIRVGKAPPLHNYPTLTTIMRRSNSRDKQKVEDHKKSKRMKPERKSPIRKSKVDKRQLSLIPETEAPVPQTPEPRRRWPSSIDLLEDQLKRLTAEIKAGEAEVAKCWKAYKNAKRRCTPLYVRERDLQESLVALREAKETV